MTTQMRQCRCCGAEVTHNGWLDVCDNPECRSKGSREHFRNKHLGIFPVRGAGPGVFYGVGVCDLDDPDCITIRSAYFGTETQAQAFVAYVRTGMSKEELAALVEAHQESPTRITVEELCRRAAE
jgi:hypothetical protein